MEIADPLRSPAKNATKLPEVNTTYGYIDKIIDAMQFNIDSVTITITSDKFNANMNVNE
jgi:hypothetical protein